MCCYCGVFYFFFFKQKTAYEMRISDWSSDVCSSDLPFSIRDWITGDKKPGAILFVTSNYIDLPMNRALLTLWMDLAINRLMTLPRTRSLRTWFMFDELGALHRLPAIENGLQTGRAFRSEEHTSELQSLMRISYAVFCLK